MRTTALAVLAVFLAVSFGGPLPGHAQDPSEHNTLTQQEKEQGWRLLFDGETTNGWREYTDESFPDQGWSVTDDGTLRIRGSTGGGGESGGDIVTTETYDDFVLTLEWKIAKGGNSGIFYRAIEQEEQPIYWSAPEMQVLDNAHHPDATRGQDGNRKAGSLYDLIPAQP